MVAHAHLCHTHPQNANQFISQFIISDEEKALMKAKWDTIQMALNTHHRFKKLKGKKASTFTIADTHSSKLILE